MNKVPTLARIAAVLAGLAAGQIASAASYYIDIVNGSDTNAGTSTSFPKKTINGLTGTVPKVVLQPGDIVNLMGTGPYNDPAQLGRNASFGSNYSGTSAGVITVQSEPGGGKQAVFDPGYSEFMAAPNTAWVPCTDTGHHPDEYISVNTYPQTPVDGGHGSFLLSNGQASYKLLTYARVEDLRATNESWGAIIPWDGDNTHGRPIWGNTSNMYRWAYRGPGVWLDPSTNKMHIRLSSTHWNQPGITDYVSTPSPTTGTDPRTIPLSICCYAHMAINISSDYITFKNVVIQNGGGGHDGGRVTGSGTDYAEHVTFDHCQFYPGRNGFDATLTKFCKFQDCIFDGKLASWVCRSDVKDSWDFLDYDGVTHSSDGLCRETQVCLYQDGGNNEDLEITRCEFRNGHDGVQLWGVRPRFHHNLIENCNDEGLMFYGSVAANDVRIYNNVFRKCLQPLSSSQGSTSSTGVRYIYRNIIDERYPTLGMRILSPDTPLTTWRIGEDFKMNTPWPEVYFYQNTVVEPKISGSLCSVIWSNILTTQQWKRQYLNNIYMAVQNDASFYIIPFDPTWPNMSNGNNWCRRITNPLSPELQWYNSSSQTTTNTYATLATWLASSQEASYVAANGVGWEVNSRTTYPQFVNVPDYNPTDGGAFANADYRIKSTSPNHYTVTGTGGVTLPPPPSNDIPDATHWPDSATYTTTPDTGALPYGSAAFAVGVDSSKVFPDGQTPIAEAGDYSVVSDSDQTGFENITFDASGSSDPDGSITSYNWVYNGATISTASSFNKDLPIGTHNVFLTVTDNSGKTATDMRQVCITDPTTFDNIVVNPGFENSSNNWTLTRAGPVVSTGTHYGSGAMQLIGQTNYCSAYQEIPIIPGASTKVSCWVRTDSIPVGPKAKVQLQWLDSTHTPTGTSYYPANNIGGTTAWTYYTTTQTPPSNAVYARISLLLDSAATGGYAYFDDIRLMITDSKIVNGFMEKGTASWLNLKDLPSVTTVLTDCHSGPQAMYMPAPVNYYQTYQEFPATPTTSYQVQGWIKTNAIGGGQSAVIWLEWYDASNARIGSTLQVGSSLTGTNPYTLEQSTLVAPANTVKGRVILRSTGGTGSTTWFDDIYVK